MRRSSLVWTVLLVAGLVFALVAGAAPPIDCAAPGKGKLFDRLARKGKAGIRYRSGKALCLDKGPGSADPGTLSGSFQIVYLDTVGGSAGSAFVGAEFDLPSPWLLNRDGKAKYRNGSAPIGGGIKLASIRTLRAARAGSRSLGDSRQIDLSNPPGPSGVLAVMTLHNAVDASTRRVCTRWSEGDGSVLQHDVLDDGLGYRLLLKGGVASGCDVGPIPTTTTSSVTSSSSTSSSVTTSTTVPRLYTFETGTPQGDCGVVRSGGASGALLTNLGCGGLNLGGGGSTLAEGGTPEGAPSRFTAACGTRSCLLGPTPNDGSNDCTGVGCPFGPPLPIENAGTSTCVLNTFEFDGSGVLDLATGLFDGAIPLLSRTYLTGNAVEPCPLCRDQGGGDFQCDPGWIDAAGSPSPDARALCTPLNAAGNSYDCLPPTQPLTCDVDALPPDPNACTSPFTPFSVPLDPARSDTIDADSTTATAGDFCGANGVIGVGTGSAPWQNGETGQATRGCFGNGSCDYIRADGVPAGALDVSPGSHAITLASLFCVPATGNFVVDSAANLPGPGEVTLPGTGTISLP